MYLKSLEISGFKSFAKKATLSFSTPISAIVGPNGSGKSNVAEAFRFVLGEQSIKSMRGKRGEDLIFNGGGEGSGRLNRGSVKVTFDNSRKLLALDFNEVTLERVVHRDSSNEYFINGSPARLRDIIELLSGAHIGASGHHIISQGEADRILNANIRERREMIEDALGLKIYQYKKAESQRKLTKTEENMKSVESLRREIAPHIKFLKKQVEKVEKVQELRTQLQTLYKEYFKREEDYLKKERLDIDHQKSPVAKELGELDREIESARRILEQSKNRDAKSDELMALEAKLQKVRTEKDAIMRDLGKIEGEISASERSLSREREKIARDEFRTVYLKDVEEVVRHVSLLETIAEIKAALLNFISNHRRKEGSVDMQSLEQELKVHKDKRADLEINLKRTDELERAEMLEYNTLRVRIEKEKDSNRDAEKDVFRIIARQNELRGQLSQVKAREERYLLDEESFKRELQDAYLLIGRESMDYKDLAFSDEPRNAQHDRLRSIEKIKFPVLI